MPPMPAGAEDGILKGMYRLNEAAGKAQVHLFGSGSILNEALKAQDILRKDYEVAADVWSITSFKELHRDGVETERWNLLHPESEPRIPYLTRCLEHAEGSFVVASDYVKALPNSVARWFPRPPVALGTDGFGRSDGRGALRDFFEVDARYYVLGALGDLARQGKLAKARVLEARSALQIDPDKIDPLPN